MRELSADALARFGGLGGAGRCLQARTFAWLFPHGFDVDANPRALLQAIPRIRRARLDIVYGAIYLSRDDAEIAGFVDLLLRQGDGLEGNRHLFQARGAATAHATKPCAYRLARLTLAATRLERGKAAEAAARQAQDDYWVAILRRMARGA